MHSQFHASNLLQSASSCRNSGAPNGLQMLHTPPDIFRREGWTQFEHFDVLRSDPWLERSEINHPRSRRTMVPARELNVMDMKPGQPVRQGFQVHGMPDESQVLLDLRVACVVPVHQAGAGNLPK